MLPVQPRAAGDPAPTVRHPLHAERAHGSVPGVVAQPVSDRHSSRANRRVNRPRYDPCWYARFAMRIWRDWKVAEQERGWPTKSSEVVAQHRARTATVVDGAAAYRGRVEVGDNGRTVPKEPPPMPKETRPSAGPRIPDIDRARLGPEVDRCILDLAESAPDTAAALQAHYLDEKSTAEKRAAELGMSVRAYWNHHDRGLMWLAGRFSAARPRS